MRISSRRSNGNVRQEPAPPGRAHTDQGSQFTSGVWTGMLKCAGVRVSMDGGLWLDSVCIDRLWPGVKREARGPRYVPNGPPQRGSPIGRRLDEPVWSTNLVDAEKQCKTLPCNGLRVNCGTLYAPPDMLLLVKTGKTHEAEAFARHHSARPFSD